VPVSSGGKDSIDNGILLCRNHDHLFEFGKIKIGPEGRISCDNEKTCEVLKMRFPSNVKYHPSPDNFKRKLELLSNKNDEQ